MRSPLLYDTLRRFCLGAFALFHQDLDGGSDLPFAFEEHGSYGRPTLYEYRPLVRGFIEARADRLFQRDDVRSAVADLQREPAARIFARAHEGLSPDEPRALYRSVLVPLLVRTAESVRRLRLGRRRLRPRVRGARGIALRRRPRVRRGRPARRHLLRDGDRARRRHPRPRRGGGRARRHVARGGGTAPARLRTRGGPAAACSSSSGRSSPARTRLRTLRVSWPTRSRLSGCPRRRRSRPDPSSSSGSTGGRTGSVPSCRSPRPRLRASRRASIRSAPPSPRSCGRSSPARTTTRSSARRSIAGSCRSSRPSRSARSSSATHWTARSATATERGRPGCAAPRCSATLRRSGPTSPSASRSRRPDLMRRLILELLLHGNRRRLVRELDDALLALRPRPARVAELRAS